MHHNDAIEVVKNYDENSITIQSELVYMICLIKK